MSSKARWILFPSIKVDFVWCADVTRGLLSGFEAMGCNCVTSGKICLFAFQFAAADRSMVHSLAAGLPWRQQTPNRFPDPLKWRFLDENYSFSVKSSEKIHVFMYITANMCPKAQIVNIFRVRSKMANFAGASTLIIIITWTIIIILKLWLLLISSVSMVIDLQRSIALRWTTIVTMKKTLVIIMSNVMIMNHTIQNTYIIHRVR